MTGNATTPTRRPVPFRRPRTALILCLIGMAMATLVYALPVLAYRSEHFDRLVLLTFEDGVFESVGAVLIVAAGIVFLGVALYSRNSLHTLGCALLGIGSLLLALEELNWGQRIFGLETPAWIEESNIQEELSLHNLAVFQSERGSNWLVGTMKLGAIFVFGILPIGLAIASKIKHRKTRWPIPVPGMFLVGVLAACLVGEVISAGMIFPTVDWLGLHIASECGELIFAGMLAAWAVDELLLLPREAIDLSRQLVIGMLAMGFSLFVGTAVWLTREPIPMTGREIYSQKLLASAQAALSMGDPELATLLYQASIDVQPRPEALAKLAVIEFNAGRPEQALQLAEQLLELSPHDPNTLHLLGTISIQLSRFDEAEKYLQQAIQLASSDAGIYVTQARLAIARGDNETALRRARQALQVEPGRADAEQVLEQINNLRQSPPSGG